MTTTITIYRPTHDVSCMDIPTDSEQERLDNREIYDANIDAYFEHTRKELATEGFNLEISPTDHGGQSYTVEAETTESEERAHFLMSQGGLKDFWTWHN